MPRNNRFQHQKYLPPASDEAIECIRPTASSISFDNWASRMRLAGLAWRQAGVAAVYLVHGTFVGGDALGLLREVARLAPDAGRKLRQLQKRTWEKVTQDAGNYTEEFAAELDSAINSDFEALIPVINFEWSSENHHIGRADGAVRLIHDIHDRQFPEGSRILFWAHSHGGNLLALVSNLLSNDWSTNRKFFRAARSFFRWSGTAKLDLPVWNDVRRLLREDEHQIRTLSLDVATFGTPVRYGWDTGCCSRLLHFVYHRPGAEGPDWKAALPASLNDILQAVGGDYIQQLAVAGTNIAPPLWSWHSWIADVRLGRLLQSDQRRRDLLERLRGSVRVHEDGVNLLVDYGPSVGHIGQHFAGHAVYTRHQWMQFHTEEISRRFYGLGAGTLESLDPSCTRRLDDD